MGCSCLGFQNCVPPPRVSDFTWINQGGATAVNTSGPVGGGQALIMNIPASGVDSIRALVMSAPPPPYEVILGWIPLFVRINFFNAGFIWREAATGEMTSVALQVSAASGYETAIQKWDSPTVLNSTYANTVFGMQCYNAAWCRMSDDGINRKVEWSFDGISFATDFFSVARTDFLTPDQIGVYGNVINAGVPWVRNTIISWNVRKL